MTIHPDAAAAANTAADPPDPFEPATIDQLPTSWWAANGITQPANSIVYLSYKGGVGKTTLLLLVADALARFGLNVHVQDIEPQGNTSMALGREVTFETIGTDRLGREIKRAAAPTVAEVVNADGGGQIDQATLLVPWHDRALRRESFTRGGPLLPDRGFGAVGLLPSTDALESDADAWTSPAQLRKLRRAWQEPLPGESVPPSSRWDVMVMDTPPSGSNLRRLATLAADFAQIVSNPESFSAHAVRKTLEFVESMRVDYEHPGLQVAGLAFNSYASKLKLSQRITSEVEQAIQSGEMPVELWPERIPVRTQIGTAHDYQIPVSRMLTGKLPYLGPTRPDDRIDREQVVLLAQAAESMALHTLEVMGHPAFDTVAEAWVDAWGDALDLAALGWES